MRAVLQRVAGATVIVDGDARGSIGPGLLIYVGVASGDAPGTAEKTAAKIASLRIFNDDAGRLNRSLVDTGGEALAIPNFTLMGDAAKGRRPAYTDAAPPADAEALFDDFVAALAARAARVEKGVFGADMTIESTARGPVNIIVDIPPPAS